MIVYQEGPVTLHHDDCLVALRGMADESVHAVVTDPPYGLANTDPAHVVEALTKWATGDREFIPEGRGFMGKAWDAFVPPPAVWDECLRVLKPGGHLLAFAGSRTFDLMALSIRFAGFDIRDSIAWLYGSGFPKSQDVSKAIDKRPGVGWHDEFKAELKAAREAAGMSRRELAEHVVGTDSGAVWNWEHHQFPSAKWWPAVRDRLGMNGDKWDSIIAEANRVKTGERKTGIGTGKGGTAIMGDSADRARYDKATTPEAAEWQGWGTALKPAFEPIVVARKPFPGTVAANVLAHGTGALNIDATRIGSEERRNPPAGATTNESASIGSGWRDDAQTSTVTGRWPANVILDESQAAELDRQAPNTGGSGKASGPTLTGGSTSVARGAFGGVDSTPFYGGDLGGASRFFYVAKAPTSERPEVEGTMHATVKPLDLMQRLIRLVTPPGGIVVDPFAGSGTTLEAAVREGFATIGVEREAEYLPLILKRVQKDHAQSLFGDDL